MQRSPSPVKSGLSSPAVPLRLQRSSSTLPPIRSGSAVFASASSGGLLGAEAAMAIRDIDRDGVMSPGMGSRSRNASPARSPSSGPGSPLVPKLRSPSPAKDQSLRRIATMAAMGTGERDRGATSDVGGLMRRESSSSLLKRASSKSELPLPGGSASAPIAARPAPGLDGHAPDDAEGGVGADQAEGGGRPVDGLAWYLKTLHLPSNAPQRVVDGLRANLVQLQQHTTYSAHDLVWLWDAFGRGVEQNQVITSGPRLALALVGGGVEPGMLDNLVPQVFYAFDADGNGVIEFHEFALGLAMFRHQYKKDKTMLRFSFRLFDVDHNGTIECDEIFSLLRALLNNAAQVLLGGGGRGSRAASPERASRGFFTDEEVRRFVRFIVKQADTEQRDGVISATEYERWAPLSPVVYGVLCAFTQPQRFMHEFGKWFTRMLTY